MKGYLLATKKNNKNIRSAQRLSFAKTREPIDLPNLLTLQTESFEWLVGADAWRKKVGPDAKTGLDEVFEELSPIEDNPNNPAEAKMGLEFKEPALDAPNFTPDECKVKGKTYARPLYIKAEFTNYKTGEIKSQTVFMGEFPIMTNEGTFIVNGTERVVVSQLVRSPGVYFSVSTNTTGNLDVRNNKAQIIPSRGSYLEFLTEWVKDDRKSVSRFGKPILQVQVDRKTKVSATIFLKALGMTRDDIVAAFADVKDAVTSTPGWEIDVDLINNTLDYDESRAFTTPVITKEDALKEMYRKVRGESGNADAAEAWLKSVYFDKKRYNLARVGRHKLNRKLGIAVDDNTTVLTPEDIVATMKYLLVFDLALKNKADITSNMTFGLKMSGKKVDVKIASDDIDDFQNRRIRPVGELIQNQVRIGLSRMERVVRERMSTQDVEAITPQTLINLRPVVSAIKEFFGASQLSQFMDQNNPLAGLAHKRRLSALGPGGIARERAQMEVRDVHPSHYGRMCPVETPEGPNIGLIGSLTAYARINTFGFIETPYNKVVNGKVSGKIEYLDAASEDGKVIGGADVPLNADNTFANKKVFARYKGDVVEVDNDTVDYIDISPRQLASVSTSLIPFLEHDDSSRALMGANMQRQAVPLLRSEAPLVGTGMERAAAMDSHAVVLSRAAGVVEEVDADHIVVRGDDNKQEKYFLRKFERSNQGTAINQRAIVSVGQKIEAGEALADGPSTDQGELALGKNLLVAFMPWEGHNFEDAIIISQALVKEDTLSSIHIEAHEVEARDTKLGKEEITADLPNVSMEALAQLDERGIIRIGAEVRPGDILVGKVTPKGETELSAEERLLRAIFNEKSREVRDTSLKVPHGEAGTVIDVKVFDIEEDEMAAGVNQRVVVHIAQKRKITEGDKLAGRHGNKGVISKILPIEDMPFLEDGTPVDIILNPLGIPGRMNFGQVLETHLGWIAKQGWQIKEGAKWAQHLAEELHSAAPGTKVATPIFDGAHKDDIIGLLDSTLPNRDGQKLVDKSGKARLFDGRSGEPFPMPISVGYMYVLKLHHLVDDKIHARSTGPYSMITQQPLGGKAQFGGQRFGEMEVWALQAYGAAHTLQELLTIKSDDINGRIKTYEAIVKGENIQAPGIPESFRVLAKEMQSLALNVEVLNAEGTIVTLKDDEYERDMATEQLDGINLSRNESLSNDSDEPLYF
ncbi:MAG: DNA-directed RNA polymerase subunit beta [Micrococcales bacterium]|nr:DNA-directed RNA polymerase subunit beta [Micrococcales bacterium]NBS60575.1 DNA-directed RNA polymerase subunit beta [Microbacteriaceae bacterium]NBS85217.1 DNA-directed RNA polymerase subunit beta [Micrococcales bacterium]NBX94325.1 DNA-directed RNA polymerase subunit beta [Actinomycetota bacterium]